MQIEKNLSILKSSIPNNIDIVAVSKTKPINDLKEAYHAGQRIFGENKVQEMVSKFDQLPKDILWHMIGHLQTNKVKYIASFVNTIHSVDSHKLLKEIQKQAFKRNREIKCLIQIRIANEETKFGIKPSELEEFLNFSKTLPNIKISGLMGMASFTEDKNQIRNEFRSLSKLYNSYNNLRVLSMGMSGDYQIGIEEGSTMVRIGSKIFGERNY
tara:strand:- start:30594 stop:31232 length:639 start_codon:yes stop_codon:yes gene_type:complete